MEGNIRVLHVTTSYPKNSDDTSGIFIKRLVDAITKKGISCQVLTSCTCSPKDFCDKAVITFRYAPWKLQCLTNNPGGILSCLRRKPAVSFLLPSFVINMLLKLIFAARRSHLIHAHWTFSGALAGITKHIHHKKIITTIRGSDLNTADNIAINTLLKITMEKSDKIVCVSNTLREILERKFPEHVHKITYIGNGVGEEFFEINPENEDTSKLILTTICSLTPNKRVEDIIKAISYLRELPVTLNVVGDGELKLSLERLTKELNLQDKVNFLGQVPPIKIREILANSHGFILASEKEGRSNALLEAMASAKVVFATAIPANSELITHGENGFLFKVGDVKGLSELIREFYHSYSIKRELGLKARKTISRLNLSWENCADNYVSLYRELLNA